MIPPIAFLDAAIGATPDAQAAADASGQGAEGDVFAEVLAALQAARPATANRDGATEEPASDDVLQGEHDEGSDPATDSNKRPSTEGLEVRAAASDPASELDTAARAKNAPTHETSAREPHLAGPLVERNDARRDPAPLPTPSAPEVSDSARSSSSEPREASVAASTAPPERLSAITPERIEATGREHASSETPSRTESPHTSDARSIDAGTPTRNDAAQGTANDALRRSLDEPGTRQTIDSPRSDRPRPDAILEPGTSTAAASGSAAELREPQRAEDSGRAGSIPPHDASGAPSTRPRVATLEADVRQARVPDRSLDPPARGPIETSSSAGELSVERAQPAPALSSSGVTGDVGVGSASPGTPGATAVEAITSTPHVGKEAPIERAPESASTTSTSAASDVQRLAVKGGGDATLGSPGDSAAHVLAPRSELAALEAATAALRDPVAPPLQPTAASAPSATTAPATELTDRIATAAPALESAAAESLRSQGGDRSARSASASSNPVGANEALASASSGDAAATGSQEEASTNDRNGSERRDTAERPSRSEALLSEMRTQDRDDTASAQRFASSSAEATATPRSATPAESAIGALGATRSVAPSAPGMPTDPTARPSVSAQLENPIVRLAQDGGGTAHVRLHPVELGQVELSVRVRGSSVEIVLRADEDAAQSALSNGREFLTEALGSKDLRVESFEVTASASRSPNAPDGQSGLPFGDARDGRSANTGDHTGTGRHDERPAGPQASQATAATPNRGGETSQSAAQRSSVDLRV